MSSQELRSREIPESGRKEKVEGERVISLSEGKTTDFSARNSFRWYFYGSWIDQKYGKTADSSSELLSTLVIGFEPHAADAYYHRGCVYCTLNDAEHALADFAKAQKLDPRYSRAIAEKVLRLTPDTAEGWFSRGLALIRLKRYAQASEAFGRVLHLQPDHAQAWFEKGFTLLELERYEEALLAFVESLKTSLLLVSNRADVSQ